jgi:hypothetical protein
VSSAAEKHERIEPHRAILSLQTPRVTAGIERGDAIGDSRAFGFRHADTLTRSPPACREARLVARREETTTALPQKDAEDAEETAAEVTFMGNGPGFLVESRRGVPWRRTSLSGNPLRPLRPLW